MRQFLLEIGKTNDNDSFLNILEENLINKLEEEEIISGYSDNLKTIMSAILNQDNLKIKIEDMDEASTLMDSEKYNTFIS